MSKDSSYTYLHFLKPHHADLFEVNKHISFLPIPSHPATLPAQTKPLFISTSLPLPLLFPLIRASGSIFRFRQDFNRPPHLPDETIHVAPQHQPPNPEDEDDIVPDQHAAFGITRATQAQREVIWRDLGMERLVEGGPGTGEKKKKDGAGEGSVGDKGVKGRKMGVGMGSSLPR